jgi:hypothetical protein
MSPTFSFTNQMSQPLLASRIYVQAMCRVVISHKRSKISNTNVSHISLHHGLIMPKIHSPNTYIHQWLVVPLWEVDKTHICIVFLLQ